MDDEVLKLFIFSIAILTCVRGLDIPTCLDIVDVYPYPSSIIHPLDRKTNLIGVQVTFSRPVQVIQQSIAKRAVYLANVIPYRKELLKDFSTVTPITVYPVRINYKWYGSERSVFLIFRITTKEMKAR